MRADAVGGGAVDIIDSGDSGGGDDDTPATPETNTLRDALGPDRARARGVRIINGPMGPMRISLPRPYRGPLRRREFP